MQHKLNKSNKPLNAKEATSSGLPLKLARRLVACFANTKLKPFKIFQKSCNKDYENKKFYTMAAVNNSVFHFSDILRAPTERDENLFQTLPVHSISERAPGHMLE